jgi:hypothetical protein
VNERTLDLHIRFFSSGTTQFAEFFFLVARMIWRRRTRNPGPWLIIETQDITGVVVRNLNTEEGTNESPALLITTDGAPKFQTPRGPLVHPPLKKRLWNLLAHPVQNCHSFIKNDDLPGFRCRLRFECNTPFMFIGGSIGPVTRDYARPQHFLDGELVR